MRLVLSGIFALSTLTAGPCAAAETSGDERLRRKVITKAIKTDQGYKLWKDACRTSGKDYAFDSFKMTNPDLSVEIPTNVMSELRGYFEKCRGEASRFKVNFEREVINSPKLNITVGEEQCVGRAFLKAQDDFSKIAGKLGTLFAKLNALEMNPVPYEEYYSSEDTPGTRAAKGISEITTGDDNIYEVVADTSAQPSNTRIRIGQCFVKPMSDRHNAAMQKLGAEVPKIPLHEVD